MEDGSRSYQELSGGRSLKLKGIRVIHAGPTCGKTLFREKLVEKGIKVLDTDDLVTAFIPLWFDDKGWVRRGEPVFEELGVTITRQVALISSELLRRNVIHLVLTNLGGPNFVYFMDPAFLTSGQLPVSLFVRPEDMVERSKKREGTPFNLKLTTKWFKGWAADWASTARNRYVLSEGVYLSEIIDYVEPVMKSGSPELLPPALKAFLDSRESCDSGQLVNWESLLDGAHQNRRG
jgi:hypothetical protein